MTTPLIQPPGAGQVLDIFGATLTVKTTPQATGGPYSLLEGLFQPGGFHPLPHIHAGHDEGFYVLDGMFEFTVGDDKVLGPPGMYVHVPGGRKHHFVNAGDTPARLLVLHTPGLEGFFEEMAALSAEGPPNPKTLGALMQAWDMEVFPA